MQILETIIGLILAVIATFAIAGPLRAAIVSPNFIEQTAALASLMRDLEQEDSNTLLIDFDDKNAIILLTAASPQVQYAHSQIKGIPFSGPNNNVLKELPDFVTKELNKQREKYTTAREQFALDCKTQTCLCLCTRWQSSPAGDHCNGRFSCTPIDGVIVPPVPGASLIKDYNGVYYMLGGQVFYADSFFGPKAIVLKQTVVKEDSGTDKSLQWAFPAYGVSKAVYKKVTGPKTEQVEYKGRQLIRAQRHFNTVVLCFNDQCFNDEMRSYAEREYIQKNPAQNLNNAIRLLLDEQKTKDAFHVLTIASTEELRKFIDPLIAARLIDAMAKYDLSKSQEQNLLSFVVTQADGAYTCSTANAQKILQLIKTGKPQDEGMQLYSTMLRSFLHIHDQSKSAPSKWWGCDGFTPKAIQPYPLDSYAQELSLSKDKKGRLNQIYYWFERGIQCNEVLECIRWSGHDHQYFRNVLDLIEDAPNNNFESVDPLRLYYHASQLEHMALQWGHFGSGEFNAFREDVIQLGQRRYVYSQEQLSLFPVWIADLDAFLLQINNYYGKIIESSASEAEKAVARQAKLQFTNAVAYEKAKLYEILGQTGQAAELRRNLPSIIASLPAVEEQYVKAS